MSIQPKRPTRAARITAPTFAQKPYRRLGGFSWHQIRTPHGYQEHKCPGQAQNECHGETKRVLPDPIRASLILTEGNQRLVA
jgi:hypothetical protein